MLQNVHASDIYLNVNKCGSLRTSSEMLESLSNIEEKITKAQCRLFKQTNKNRKNIFH